MDAALDMPRADVRHALQPMAAVAGKHIVIYGMNYAPEIAGVGKYTGEIAHHLAKEDAEVTVVTTPPHYPGWTVQAGYNNRYSAVRQDDVRVLRTPLILRRNMRGIWRLIAPLSFAVSSAPVVFWQILRRRPDAVLCVEPTLLAAPVAQLAARIVKAKTVLHVQDLEVDAAFAVGHLGSRPWLKALGHAFERATLKRFDHVVTISDRMAERLVGKGIVNEKVSVVRNWVDLSHIYPLRGKSPYRSELSFRDDDFVVLYSGNIGAKQGLGILVDAARQLRAEKRIRFVVAGEGPAKAGLQAACGDLETFRFLPFQPYARLNDFLNMADLHVLPQERGAADLVLPSKLGGMLASGKPLIVTADQGTELADFLGDAAIITPPGDATALARGIAWAFDRRSEPGRDNGELCRLLAKESGLAALTGKFLP
jgi:colanic acid biosynthesis glycosyl transferase WcaI